MPRRDWRAYLEDVVVACRAVLRYTDGVDREGYASNEMLRSAVERQFGIIGEAMTQIRRMRPDKADALGDVRGIIAFRNILVHVYFAIKHETVWTIIKGEVSPLLTVAEQMLREELDKEPPEDS
jgi:uncharacterized protein with HEPN domain